MFDIVMALYNKEQFVAATVEAVLGQSYRDWRLIVVDDGSSDKGAGVVRSYDDARIRLIQQDNKGVGPARNAGVHAGSAEWIAFLDADDVWNLDHLAELDAILTEFPEAVLIGCGFSRFSGSIVPRTISGGVDRRRLVRYFAECARGSELFLTSSAAIRRTEVDASGPFKDLPGNEDVELWARLALHGPVAVSARQTVNYRVESGGITDREMEARNSLPKPMRREDLSSTIPTLEPALPSIGDAQLRGDVIAYMDSRIGIRMTAAVLDGDIAYARKLLRLYRGKPIGQARIAARLAKLPQPLAKAIVAGRRSIRHWLHR